MKPIFYKEGDRFGYLTVVKYLGHGYDGYKRYLMSCECGRLKEMRQHSLIRNRSCGCKRSKWRKEKKSFIHKKLQPIWHQINYRCNNKNHKEYKNYGGRGITCEWKTFLDFYNDMAPSYSEGLSIDRIDTNGNYEKSNCRWADIFIQNNNKRNTIYVEGEPIMQICRREGLDYHRLLYRIKRGFSLKEAKELQKGKHCLK